MQNLLSPFLAVFEWSKNTQIHIMEFSFTFFDVWIWSMIAGICISVFLYMQER